MNEPDRQCDAGEFRVRIRSALPRESRRDLRWAYFTGGALASYSYPRRMLVHRYPIYKQAAANFEMVEGTDEQLAAIRAAGFALRDGRARFVADDAELVVRSLGEHFSRVEAYRYNAASLRVRIVDPAFRGESRRRRLEVVEPRIAELPLTIQTDIIMVVMLTEAELVAAPKRAETDLRLNREFEEGRPGGRNEQQES